ncbi:MAG TPA: peptidase T [Thermoleophilaceae bacterium]|nr:peptidase T [Thermoleophilaceae bacterium]
MSPAPFTSEIAESLAPDLLERFLRYVRVNTQSLPGRDRSPSTDCQLDLLRMLMDELREIGLEDAQLDDNGFVFATLPATVDDAPVIGLIAHVDTIPELSGEGVDPIVHRDYDGGVIELPLEGVRLDPAEMPALAAAAGHDVVTASGDTLLGADDKAGVAEIMSAVAYLAAHPELPRPTLRIGFTPDEEVGEGAYLFDVERFGAVCAYTLDGSEVGELQDETFSGWEVVITIQGVDVHPGWGYGKLVNATKLAAQVVGALPAGRLSPETTRDREGYVHPTKIAATPERAEIRLIARDFDDDKLAEHVELVRRTAEDVVAAAPGARVEVEARQQYPNMRRYIEKFPAAVEAADKALRAEGIEPIRKPSRGGTDGSILSGRGLPTPNLFTGGHEYHSVREWASLQEMAAAAATVVRLAEAWTAAELRNAA